MKAYVPCFNIGSIGAWDNPKLSGNKRFYSNDVERNCFVTFHVDSILCNVTGYVSINDKFTVQEEM
ncbi:hypothetical protein I5D01_14725 [Staphylococcus aureus]|nr:hypothetical protein I5D01_14725 [Staphylococcus aureus]